MKKLKLFSRFALALISILVIAGCKQDQSKSSSVSPSTDPHSGTSISSSGGQTTPTNALEEALANDYSNATITVEQVYSYDGSSDLYEEYAYELNYEGYTIIQSLDNPELDDLYYHDYEGESYLYFEDNYGTGDAWLKLGYNDSPLGLENTYFSTRVALEELHAEDATYAAGSYIIDNPDVVERLNQTVFLFAWYIDVDYVSITVQDGYIYRLLGLTEESDDVFVRVTITDIGTTTYTKTLPEKPNEENVKTYSEYTGIEPTPEVPMTSLTIDFVDTQEDGTIEIEEEIEIKRSYLPENTTTSTVVQWFSTNPSVATIGYSFTSGQAVITGVAAGTTEVYAVSENNIESNHLTITVQPLAQSTLENCLYEFTYTSLNEDNSVTVVNQLANGKTAQVYANKASVYSGANGDNVFTADDTLLVLNPSKQGGDLVGAYVSYDFGYQQVSGISFYYGLQWNADKNNIDWLTQAEIQVSTDGVVWTMAVDILDEIVENVSSNNVKLLEAEFAPTTYVRVLLKSNMVGKDFRFCTTQMNFYANDLCEELPNEPEETKVESITISTTAIEIEVGNQLTFEAVVSPDDATNKTVIWQSSQPSKASITQDGVLTALESGTVEITATSYDGTVTSNVITITIVEQPLVLPSSYLGTWKGTDLYGVEITLTIEEESATLIVDTEEISLTLSSYDTTNQVYIFVTEDSEEVAIAIPSSYSDVLNVEAYLASTIIMANHEDSDNPAFTRVIAVTSISISAGNQSTTLNIDDSLQLNISIYPNNANEGTKVTWTSSNVDVATVSSSGQVVAKGAGETTITAESANGVTSNEIVITVNEPISGGDISEIEGIVGVWETAGGEIDYDVFEVLTLTINSDGSADLNCDASSSLADHIPFTYVRTDGTNYIFVDEEGRELTFADDGSGYAYLYYEGDYVYLYGSSAYEKIA